MATITVPRQQASSSASWLHSPLVDLATGLAWVPFALVTLVVKGDRLAMETFVAGVLLLSFSHQPLTLGLVYGDRGQFQSRRLLYVLSPLVFVAAIWAGVLISLVVVAIVGGLWNTHHTLMQRYGLTRIYRRKGGDADPGRLDLALLYTWLLVVLAAAAANPATPARIEDAMLDPVATRSLEMLVDLRVYSTMLLVIAGAAAIWTTVQWLRREIRTGFSANPATYVYLAASGGLYVLAFFAPVAALLGWIGAHAVEYYVVVQVHLRTRYTRGEAGEGAPEPTAVARLVHTRLGALGSIVVFTAVTVALTHLFLPTVGLLTYAIGVFAVGGLHIFYDGLIWKLRRPDVAKSLSATG